MQSVDELYAVMERRRDRFYRIVEEAVICVLATAEPSDGFKHWAAGWLAGIGTPEETLLALHGEQVLHKCLCETRGFHARATKLACARRKTLELDEALRRLSSDTDVCTVADSDPESVLLSIKTLCGED